LADSKTSSWGTSDELEKTLSGQRQPTDMPTVSMLTPLSRTKKRI
jgi:hypothetical protein